MRAFTTRTSERRGSNKGKTFPPQALARDEVMALLKACSRQSPTGARNAAIVATLWRSGIRCAELLALKPKDIDRAGEHLQVLRGKGGKHRLVAIDGEAIARIDLWIAKRKELGISKDADLAPAPALAPTHEHGPSPLVKVLLAQRERLLDAQPPRQSITIIARSLKP
jgi:integrase